MLSNQKLKGKFFLEGIDFHILSKTNLFSNDSITFSIESHDIQIPYEEALLLSQSAIQHQLQSPNTPFEIKGYSSRISAETVVSALSSLKKLFEDETEIVISSKNVEVFNFLGEKLDNRFLLQTCREVTSLTEKIFKLTSARFRDFSESEVPKNYEITVLSKTFNVNKAFFNILTQDNLELGNGISLSKIEGVDIEKFIECFWAFLGVLNGNPVILDDFSCEVLEAVKNQFGINYTSKSQRLAPDVSDLIQEYLSILQNGDESHPKFIEAANFIAIQFAYVPKKVLLSLPENSFESVIKSKLILLPNQDYLFEMLLPIVLNDKSKRVWLQYVDLPSVTYELLKSFVETIEFSDFDQVTLDLIKQCFRDGYIIPHVSCNFNLKRWEKPPIISTQREVQNFIHKLDQHAVAGKSRIEVAKELVVKRDELKVKNQHLEESVAVRLKILEKKSRELLSSTNENPENRTKAVPMLKAIAEYGPANKQWMYGVCLLKGIETEKNLEQAKEKFENAAKDESVEALFWLAYITQDPEERFKKFQELADKDYKPALWWVGYLKFQGLGCVQDRNEGKNCIQAVAESGDSFWAKHHAQIIRKGLFDYKPVENEAIKFENLQKGKVTDLISLFNPGIFEDMDP